MHPMDSCFAVDASFSNGVPPSRPADVRYTEHKDAEREDDGDLK